MAMAGPTKPKAGKAKTFNTKEDKDAKHTKAFCAANLLAPSP
jgi:hypothetical protein